MRTHHVSLQLIGSLCALVLAACGPVPESEQPGSTQCLKVKLQENGFATASPARISLFFSVDTCAGAPVAGLTAEQFRVFEDEQPVSIFESQQRIRPRGQKMRMYTTLLIDLSGSMLRSGEYPKLRAAADTFLDRLFTHDPDVQRVALYTFDGRKEPTPVVSFTNDRTALAAGLDSLEVRECNATVDCAGYADRRTCAGWRCVDDSTNLYGAVISGLASVEKAAALETDVPNRQATMVLFTDGTDQAARVSREAAREAVSRSTAQVFTVGLGGEVDSAALQMIGRDGYFPAQDAETLSNAFSQVADRLTQLSQRFYVLEYCSPKRNGKHALRVEARMPRSAQSDLTGSLTTEFDATGFESGCSLDEGTSPAP